MCCGYCFLKKTSQAGGLEPERVLCEGRRAAEAESDGRVAGGQGVQ